MKRRIMTFLAIVSLIAVLPIHGQQQKPQPPQYRQEPAPVTVHKISGHVYEVRGGSGANCAFIVGDKEVYVVDAKMTDQSAKDMIRAIKETTDKPISHLLITHSDGDHVNGIPGFFSICRAATRSMGIDISLVKVADPHHIGTEKASDLFDFTRHSGYVVHRGLIGIYGSP